MRRRIETSTRAWACVSQKFDHPEADPIPCGGGTPAQSIRRHAHMALDSIGRYAECSGTPLPGIERSVRRRVETSTRAWVFVSQKFDHPEADPTPRGGGLPAQSIWRPAHMTLDSIGRYAEHPGYRGIEHFLRGRIEASTCATATGLQKFDHLEAHPGPPDSGRPTQSIW